MGKSLSDYLVSEGQLTPSGEADYLNLKTINWPNGGRLQDVFQLIHADFPDTEASGTLDWLEDNDAIQQNFVSFIARSYANDSGQAAVIVCTLDVKDVQQLSQVHQFMDFWNSLDWDQLKNRLVLIVFYRDLQSQSFFSRFKKKLPLKGPADTDSMCIGELESACFETWRTQFLTNRLKIPDLPTVPDWWRKVDIHDMESNCRLKSIQREFFD